MKNESINPNAGRKRGCGSCGESESNELMQFDGILPCDSEHSPFLGQVHGEGDDLPRLLQLDNVLAVAV